MGGINHFNDFFEVVIAENRLSATIRMIKEYKFDLTFTVDELKDELVQRKVIYGYIEEALQVVVDGELDNSPLVIAKGIKPINGNDGYVQFEKNLNSRINHSEKEEFNFRNVMKIPSVTDGEKLATIISPTRGKTGKNVSGQEIPAKPGRSAKFRAGQNTELKDQSIFSTESGQISVDEKAIHVYPTFEVKGDLDLKTGNLDFIGSITIRGNIPTGYTVNAKGDIKVYGLIEGADVNAGGSIFVSEGIVATHKGQVKAALDIHASFINQANVEAGRDIFVEQSILHSNCIAKEHIYCQRGNIIGGSLSAGLEVEAKDVGNKMNTQTKLYFGVNQKVLEKEQELSATKKNLEDSLVKLKLIGDKLKEKEQVVGSLSPKEKIMLLRQRNSIKSTSQDLKEVTEEYSRLKSAFHEMKGSKLCVNGTLYPNVDVFFGKYRRKINQNHQQVNVTIENGEIVISHL